jgi:hypothetical protein
MAVDLKISGISYLNIDKEIIAKDENYKLMFSEVNTKDIIGLPIKLNHKDPQVGITTNAIRFNNQLIIEATIFGKYSHYVKDKGFRSLSLAYSTIYDDNKKVAITKNLKEISICETPNIEGCFLEFEIKNSYENLNSKDFPEIILFSKISTMTEAPKGEVPIQTQGQNPAPITTPNQTPTPIQTPEKQETPVVETKKDITPAPQKKRDLFTSEKDEDIITDIKELTPEQRDRLLFESFKEKIEPKENTNIKKNDEDLLKKMSLETQERFSKLEKMMEETIAKSEKERMESKRKVDELESKNLELQKKVLVKESDEAEESYQRFKSNFFGKSKNNQQPQPQQGQREIVVQNSKDPFIEQCKKYGPISNFSDVTGQINKTLTATKERVNKF